MPRDSTAPHSPRATRWSAARKGWVTILAALAFTSCAHRYELTTPADMGRLPMRQGMESGTVVDVTPWRYVGSQYQTHEFRYYFSRTKPLYYRSVSVARDRTILRFEERRFGDTKQWVTLQTEGETFYFSLLTTHR